MKKFQILFVFLFSLPLFSQVNIEGLRSLDTLKLHASVGIDGLLQTGNVEQQQLGINGNISFKIDKSEFIIITRAQYSWANQNEFSNDALIHLRNSNKLIGALSWESFTQYNFNRILLINNRALLGSGLRLKVFNREKVKLFLGSSIMYEYEDMQLAADDTHPRQTHFFRWSNYIAGRFYIKDDISFVTTNYYQPKINQFNDLRFLSENSLQIGVSDHLQLLINYRMRYDSIEPDALKDTDTRTSIGIRYLI